MSQMDNFKALLSERFAMVEGGGLAYVELKDNTELGLLLNDVIANIEVEPGETPGATAGRIVDALFAEIENPDRPDLKEAYMAVVKAFADKISNALSDLSASQNEANLLAQKVTDQYNVSVANDPFTREHLGKDRSAAEVNFKPFPWDTVTACLGPEKFIVHNVNDVVLTPDSERKAVVDASYMHLAANKVDPAQFSDITLEQFSEEGRALVVKQIAGTLERCEEEVAKGLSALTSKQFFTNMLSLVRQYRQKPEMALEDLFNSIEYIRVVSPVIDCLETSSVEMSGDIKAMLLANAPAVRRIMQIMGYYSTFIRHTMLNEAYLIRGGYTNPDLQKAFEEAKGDAAMLATYVLGMFQGNVDSIPLTGVTVNTIVSTASRMEEIVKQDTRNIEQRLTIAVNTYRKEAFKHQGDIWLKQLAATKTDAEEREDILDDGDDAMDILATNIATFNMPTVDACMALVMEVANSNKFSKILWKKFGAAYTKRLVEGGDVDQATIDLLESGVICDLVIQFIFKKMVAKQD